MGDTAEDFVATSRVYLALSVGTHEVSVRVESGDDTELETAATIVVGAPAVTPPPTSTGSSIARSSGLSLSIGIAFVVAVALVVAAGASMVRARQR